MLALRLARAAIVAIMRVLGRDGGPHRVGEVPALERCIALIPQLPRRLASRGW